MNLTILCLEDEPEVRDVLRRELQEFCPPFVIELAEEAEEADEIVTECAGTDHEVALILCDHLLPGKRGVDFLVELNRDPERRAIRKVLVTGQAGHDDTIVAVNQADLDHYISKPWDTEELRSVVREQLTSYVIEEVEDLNPFLPVLDPARILEAIRTRNLSE